MRVFITGASGWIGSAVVPELVAAGHEVVGLARSGASAAKLEAAGASAWRGNLDDPDGLAKAAADSDGVIHLAFQNQAAVGGGDFAAAAATDRRAVEAMGGALAGSDRPFVLASAMLGLATGRPATEDDGLVPTEQVRASPGGARLATALFVLSLRGVGVRPSVVRFAPTVHGEGDKGFMATFVDLARRRGVSGYVGDGANRWPAVHVSDAGRLVRLAAETAPAGSVLHAASEDGVALGDIAEAIGRQVGVPTASVAPADAVEHFGALGLFAGIDNPVSTVITRRLLGWEPSGPTVLDDLDAGRYTH
jgi:nucleoside-diphosphate-sugar epimerase